MCKNSTEKQRRRRHSGVRMLLQGWDPESAGSCNKTTGLVPDLEHAVPWPGRDCHAIVSHSEATHPIVMSGQHTCPVHTHTQLPHDHMSSATTTTSMNIFKQLKEKQLLLSLLSCIAWVVILIVYVHIFVFYVSVYRPNCPFGRIGHTHTPV